MHILWLWQLLHLALGLYCVVHLVYTIHAHRLPVPHHLFVCGSLMTVSASATLMVQGLAWRDRLTRGRFVAFEAAKFGLWVEWLRRVVIVARNARVRCDGEWERHRSRGGGCVEGVYPGDVHVWFAVVVAYVGPSCFCTAADDKGELGCRLSWESCRRCCVWFGGRFDDAKCRLLRIRHSPMTASMRWSILIRQ